MKLKRKKALEEQKQKDEEERINNLNLYEELQKVRDEMGGPYFSKADNQKLRCDIKKARKQYKKINQNTENDQFNPCDSEKIDFNID